MSRAEKGKLKLDVERQPFRCESGVSAHDEEFDKERKLIVISYDHFLLVFPLEICFSGDGIILELLVDR